MGINTLGLMGQARFVRVMLLQILELVLAGPLKVNPDMRKVKKFPRVSF